MLFLLQDQWHIVLISAAFLIGCAEAGFRIGNRYHSNVDEPSRGQITTMEGAVLGLLGLLLGFTFAMTVSRYDLRKQLVLAEANAIGTTYLRAGFLSESRASEVRDLLRRYVDVRLEFYRAGADQGRLEVALDRGKQLQGELWTLANAVARDDARSIPVGLFIQALNETIDLDAKRVAALENHVPDTVWVLVLLVAALATFSLGYGSGLGGHRIGLPMFVTPLLITAVITIVVDMDRPRRGFIQVSQESMIRLRADLNEKVKSP